MGRGVICDVPLGGGGGLKKGGSSRRAYQYTLTYRVPPPPPPGICQIMRNHFVQYRFIISPVRSTYGGYYGLVVVTPRPPPRPQTLHRSHDNLTLSDKKSLSDCFHILYVD